MNDAWYGPAFVQISLAPMLIGALAAVSCALPGNFLLLRRQSLLGDAISHVALPGIVVAFLLTGAVSAWPMMLGAGAAALLSVAMIEALKRLGKVDPGAAMGAVFTAMFAGGVLLLAQSDTSNVHLDVEHALYGNLESLIWPAADGWGSLFDPGALSELPPQLGRIATVAALIGILTVIFWRPLALTAFDEDYARSVGLPAGLIWSGLAGAAAVACVAAFDAVGAIIVIAMLICPPASARMMTDRLDRQVLWSLAFAATASVSGYVLAGYGPLWFGAEHAVSAAGMIATMSGVILAAASVVGPKRRPLVRESEF